VNFFSQGWLVVKFIGYPPFVNNNLIWISCYGVWGCVSINKLCMIYKVI